MRQSYPLLIGVFLVCCTTAWALETKTSTKQTVVRGVRMTKDECLSDRMHISITQSAACKSGQACNLDTADGKKILKCIDAQ
jgi:hypothetical protein